MQPEYINIEEAASRLGCTSRTIRRRIKDGVFPAPMTLGSAYQWDAVDIEHFRQTERARAEAEMARRRAAHAQGQK